MSKHNFGIQNTLQTFDICCRLVPGCSVSSEESLRNWSVRYEFELKRLNGFTLGLPFRIVLLNMKLVTCEYECPFFLQIHLHTTQPGRVTEKY